MKMISKAILTCGLLATLSAPSVHAQRSEAFRARIPFEFSAGDKLLPAGVYSFSDKIPGIIMVDSITDTKTRMRSMKIVTRLSRDSSLRTGRIVFDKVGDQRFLSEIWPSGADGYLVHGSRAEHEHQTVAVESK